MFISEFDLYNSLMTIDNSTSFMVIVSVKHSKYFQYYADVRR